MGNKIAYKYIVKFYYHPFVVGLVYNVRTPVAVLADGGMLRGCCVGKLSNEMIIILLSLERIEKVFLRCPFRLMLFRFLLLYYNNAWRGVEYRHLVAHSVAFVFVVRGQTRKHIFLSNH